MRVEEGIPVPMFDGRHHNGPTEAIVSTHSAAGEGGDHRAAGLPEEEVAADEDDDEDI